MSLKRITKTVLRAGASLAAPLLYRKMFHGARPLEWKDGRHAAVTLSFDADREEDVKALPALAELLASYDMPSTLAAVGKWVEKYPRLHSRFLDDGHELMNHTYSHPNHEVFAPDRYFNKLSPAEQMEDIARFDTVAKAKLGMQAVGFRTPHFGNLHTSSVYQILAKLGYKYSSSTSWVQSKSKGRPFLTATGVLELPVVTCPSHYFPVFDSVHVLRTEPPAHRPEDFPNLFSRAVHLGERYGAYAYFYFDPADCVNWKPFEAALEWLASNKARTWVATSEAVARWWNATQRKTSP